MTPVEVAMLACIRAHAGQVRKDLGVPYAVHPIAVAKLVAQLGIAEPAVLVAALLHDVVEDTTVTLADVALEHGADVAACVRELTHAPGADKAAYLAGFAGASVEALVIKIADRYDNVLDYVRVNRGDKAARYSASASGLYDAVDTRLSEIGHRFGARAAAGAQSWVRELRAIARGEDA